MIGFIGGGNMAEAMVKGIIQGGMKDIMVSELRASGVHILRRHTISKQLPIIKRL